MNRRDALWLLQSALVGSAASFYASPSLAARARANRWPVALLLPRTGPQAALGLSMERAARLVDDDPARLVAFDTGGTAEGAARAASAAAKRNAAMIVGPITAGETLAASAAAPGVPMIAFTNTPAAAANGAFVFGLTAQQSTSAVLRYARSRGVRTVALVSDASAWGTAVAASAERLQGELGIDIRALPAAGDAPDAVLVPGNGAPLLAAARASRDAGMQVLGTVQALDHRPMALDALDGAWIASPDPAAFGGFSAEFAARNGGDAGALAALAYDAAGIVKSLRDTGRLSREGLLAVESFACVTGAARFRTDGSTARDLAIVVAGQGGYRMVATSRGA